MSDQAQQIKIKLCDMTSDLLKDVQYIILENLRKHSNERDIAYYTIFFVNLFLQNRQNERKIKRILLDDFIKRELDKRHLGPWHCVVGKNFGLFVTHEEGYYLQAIKGQITVVVWK